MKSKICHVTSAHGRFDGRIFCKECVSLAKAGYDTYLIVNDSKGNEVKENVKVIAANEEPYKNRIHRILSVKKILRKCIEVDAEVYHLHDPELLLIANRLKKLKKKVIFDSHENYSMQILGKKYIPRPLRGITGKLYYRFETRVCKKIDAVIFPCPVDGKNPFDGRTKKSVYIDNVPILKDLNFDIKDTCRTENMQVCCAGSLTKARGIEVLVEACYRAGIKLILAGDFSPKEFGHALRNNEAFGIVDYRGKCTYEEIQQIYHESFIGASNILWEGQYPKINNLPTKVYEYMMMGMPFIISDFDYSKKIVDKYKCGIVVKPDSIDEVADAIKYLASHIEESLQMGQNGRKAVEEDFNWSVEEKKLLELYDGL